MKKIVSSLLCVVLSALASQAANIAWVTFHPADGTPSANAALAGFTVAPDIGYTALLAAQGHTVTRIVRFDSATPALVAPLNAYDLVVISRSVPSGDFQTSPGEVEAWNSITAPMMLLNGYVARNSRLGFVNGGNLPDTTNNISLTAIAPAHPIFNGVALDAGNSMVNPYATVVSFTNTLLQRGISVTTDSLAGSGTLIATYPNFGANMIAEWQAGSANSRGGTFAGHRLMFLTGSREQTITSEGAGMYDLLPDGEKMFLNAVIYMIPEPSTLALIALGGLAFLLRRKN
jgi:hypothetical protein